MKLNSRRNYGSLKSYLDEVDAISAKKDKLVPDKERLDEIVGNILENEDFTEEMVNELYSKRKWTPSTLEAFGKQMLSKCRDEGINDRHKKFLLALLRANRKGQWLKELPLVLAYLLEQGDAEALEILRGIIEKPRSSKDPDVWKVYEKSFLNPFRVLNGLAYLLSIWLKYWPQPPNAHLETVITHLLQKLNSMQQIRVMSDPAREAFTAYLKNRALGPGSFRPFERRLMDLLGKYQDPQWLASLGAINSQGVAGGKIPIPTVAKPLSTTEMLPKRLTDSDLVAKEKKELPEIKKPEAEKSFGAAPQRENHIAQIGILQGFERSKNDFIRQLALLTLEHQKITDANDRLSRVLQKRDQTVKKLEEKLADLEFRFSVQVEKAEKSEAKIKGLQEDIRKQEQECMECNKRAEERVHQIQMQAENEVNKLKHDLWVRMRPDFDNLLGDNLREDDFATPDRGRILFGIVRNVVRALRDFGVIN